MTVIHPALVHFPIAFYLLECLLLGLFVWKHDEAYRRFALFSFRLAYGTALLAMAAGLRDAGGFANIKGELLDHVIAADVLFLFATARAFYWKLGRNHRLQGLYLFLSALAAAAVVVVTGFLGGELVYK